MGALAVVGMDCRFPGAPDLAGFWELLTRSGDGTGEVPEQRWSARDFYAPDGAPGRSNTTRGGFVGDADAFDDEFFTVTPREAAAMDPQQRLLLQTAWRAIEDAGVAPQRLAGTGTGVFVGIMGNEWAHLSATDYANLTTQAISGNGYCMTANRISYHLDLKGQSIAVDTACSSSLVAVHLAGNALLSGECDYALAAGVNLAVTPGLSIYYTQAGISAPDGRCKPFSADADGIGRAEGVGAVVLRRLEDALADGQRIYAVVRGTAVNQDGRSNGITAPNRWAQREVIAAACRRAGIEPGAVDFLEAHGTGTALGDRIEANALGDLHSGRSGRPLAIGSVKGNIGHAEGAAGIAGLIKAALALHYRFVPASRFAAREDPRLRLAERGLRLIKAPMRLPAGAALAGVSSFGLGGTNAHAVLESAPPAAKRGARAHVAVSHNTASQTAASHTGASHNTASRAAASHPDTARPAVPGAATTPVPAYADAETGVGVAVFALTAASPEALRGNLLAQAAAVSRHRGPVAGLCWASNEIKTGLRFRFAVPAADARELADALRAAADDPTVATRAAARPMRRPRPAFLFTGQGSQYPGMTSGLLHDSPLYRGFLREADDALAPYVGTSIAEMIASGDARIHRTLYAQPALFAVGYAQARTLRALGIEPAMLLGHSLGEYAAACIADVFPLEGAARLVAARAALTDQLPAGGGMLAVRAPEPELLDLLDREPEATVGAVNGPGATVLTGRRDALDRIAAALTARGVRTRPLEVTHAFHSPLMEPMLARFAEVARKVGGAAPRLPLYSTVRGRALLPDEPMDADYWVEHVRGRVRFAEAAAALLGTGRPTNLVELGPKPTLGPLVHRIGPRPGSHTLYLSPQEDSGGRALAAVVAELFRAGIDPVWSALYRPEERQDAPHLAPYVFSDAHRYWGRKPVTALQPGAGDPMAWEGSGWEGAGWDGAPWSGGDAETRSEDVDAMSGASGWPGAQDGPDEVWEAVVAAISQVGDYTPARISAGSRLYEDLGFDSVHAMELRDRLEARLEAARELTTQELLPAMSTAGELADFLRARARTRVG